MCWRAGMPGYCGSRGTLEGVSMAFDSAPNSPRGRQALSRRRLLRVTVQGGAALAVASVLSACAPNSAPTAPAAATQPAAQTGPGGFSGGGSLKLLMRSHFVPAYDTWLDDWAKNVWGPKNRVSVEVDHILSAELAAKLAAEVAASSGHDIYALTRAGEPLLYRNHMVDVTDISKQIGEAHGGWIPLAESLGLSEGTWTAVPEFFIDFPALYRKDIFDANGLQPVETWDDLLQWPVVEVEGQPHRHLHQPEKQRRQQQLDGRAVVVRRLHRRRRWEDGDSELT